MHRLRRQLKPNIPYNKKSAFQKAAAQLCAAAFCYVQISAATVYTAL